MAMRAVVAILASLVALVAAVPVDFRPSLLKGEERTPLPPMPFPVPQDGSRFRSLAGVSSELLQSARMEAYEPKKTSQKDVDKIYQLAQDFSSYMDSKGCRYWAEGGTQLGVRRHGGLIPWDDDLDFGMPTEEENCLADGEAELKANANICLWKWFYGYKFFPCDGAYIPKDPKTEGTKYDNDDPLHQPFRYPFADVFLVSFNSKGQSFYPRTNLWKECWWTEKQLDNLERCNFGPVRLYCSTNPDAYLDRCYRGSDWRVAAYKGKDHSTGQLLGDAAQSMNSCKSTGPMPRCPAAQPNANLKIRF